MDEKIKQTAPNLLDLLLDLLESEYKINKQSGAILIAENPNIFNTYLKDGPKSIYAAAMLLDWKWHYREQN